MVVIPYNAMSLRRCGQALVVLVALFGSSAGQGADTTSPATIAAHRQEMLNTMGTDAYPPDLVADVRRLCALGKEPADVAEDRAKGAYFTPDAADTCVTLLMRTAHDGRLPDLYRKLLIDAGGDVAGYERLPGAIGAAVMGGATNVSIGNGKAADIAPALAFDAGFTVAYQKGTTGKPASADAGQLKTLAEACLGQRVDASTCFSAGYMYGARAATAR